MTVSPIGDVLDVSSGGGPSHGRFLTTFVACPTCRQKQTMSARSTYRCGGCGRRFTSHEGVRTYMELAG
jgi:DNA-directed RNA polymerase subunit RPC12/RpoP